MLLLLGGLSALTSAGSDAALQICRPTLARKAGGDIQTISVTSAQKVRGGFIMAGQLTVFIGMEPPQPGSASAHHLIRANFAFNCRTIGKNVRKATVRPL